MRAASAHGKGEFGLLCVICGICNTRMTDEESYNGWVNPSGATRRDIKAVPANVVITHTLFQCFQYRRLAQAAAQGKPELQWLVAELDSNVVQRILVAAMIYQERHAS